jgi:hypothetical protein
METFINIAALVMTTIFALFSALALQALLLRGFFALVQPATADRRVAPPSIARGAQLVVRAYAKPS